MVLLYLQSNHDYRATTNKYYSDIRIQKGLQSTPQLSICGDDILISQEVSLDQCFQPTD